MATTLPYPAILEMVAAMPEGARLNLIADLLQPAKGSPVEWSDDAGDALLPLSDALDANWRTFNGVMTYSAPCYASGRDGMTDPYFGREFAA
jgi:hypothetical protein